MTYLFRKITVSCGLAGMLALGAAAPSLAQVVVDPYYGGAYGYVGPYGHAGPYGYVSPYQGYAYVPGYRGRRAWDYPLGYDNTGRPYFRDDLGWRPGPPSGAPANPCWEGQRQQNLC
jgi:hypothetical protein